MRVNEMCETYSPEIDINFLINQPDAEPLRRGKDLDDYLSLFTIPFLIFEDEIEPENLRDRGSGILVDLFGKYFVLTAGHCVRSAGENYRRLVVPAISNRKTRYEMEIISPDFVFSEGEADYGYFEINEKHKNIIESQSKVFLGTRRLLVTSPESLHEFDDWMIINGYPRQTYQTDTDADGRVQAHYARHLLVCCVLPNQVILQSSQMPPEWDDCDTVDFCIPEAGQIDIISGEFCETHIPELDGASGGGCWKTNFRTQRKEWSPNNCQLIGTHVASHFDIMINEERSILTREVLLINHLRLICLNHPDLSQKISDYYCIDF